MTMRVHALLTAFTFLAALPAGPAFATAQRTFVAPTGSDANACSLAAPCRSFGAAIAQTNAGGEIIVLDSAGYGRVTINKSVSIVSPAGVYAGISVFAATNGIDILTPGLKVTLEGLSINGQGGQWGIYMNAASTLSVARCGLSGMNYSGLYVDAAGAKVSVRDSVARGNGTSGFVFVSASTATLDHVQADDNQVAGVGVYEGASVTIRGSTFARNAKGIDVVSAGGTSVATYLHASDVVISNSSQYGIYGIAAHTNGILMHVVRSSIAAVDVSTPGVSLNVDASSTAFGLFVDNAFTGVVVGVEALRPAAGGVLKITLTRNAFLGTSAFSASPGVGVISGDGNSVGGITGYIAPPNFSW